MYLVSVRLNQKFIQVVLIFSYKLKSSILVQIFSWSILNVLSEVRLDTILIRVARMVDFLTSS